MTRLPLMPYSTTGCDATTVIGYVRNTTLSPGFNPRFTTVVMVITVPELLVGPKGINKFAVGMIVNVLLVPGAERSCKRIMMLSEMLRLLIKYTVIVKLSNVETLLRVNALMLAPIVASVVKLPDTGVEFTKLPPNPT